MLNGIFLGIAVRWAESGKLLRDRTLLHLFPSCAHETKIGTKGGQAPTQVDFQKHKRQFPNSNTLGDPGAVSGGGKKPKRAKNSQERREEPLGTRS